MATSTVKLVKISVEQSKTLFSFCIPVNDQVGQALIRQDGMANGYGKVMVTCRNIMGEKIVITCLCNNPNRVLLDSFQAMFM